MMIAQGILPFKLERTEELITPRSGLVLFAEVIRSLKVKAKVGEHFPPPGSNRGYEAWEYVEPLLLMMEGGGRHVEDLREIEEDRALRKLVGLERMPSASTVGDWLMRVGAGGGVEAMAEVDEEVAVAIGQRLAQAEYTLDVDATVIEAEKQEARWTYKKVRGYQPILGFLAESGVCVAHEFREGNVAAQSRAVKFVRRCLKRCPKIKRLRSDSAFYQGQVINFCEEKGIEFTITADQTAGVKEVIKTVRDWKPLRTSEGEETDREVGTAIHMVAKAHEAVGLVVQRWHDPQLQLFEPSGYCYSVIATNRHELSAEEVVWFHNERGQAENLIKELKIGLGMEQMTSGNFGANALWFAIGVLAYNLTQAQKLLFLGGEWVKRTVATLRWKLIERAGRLVRHGRQWVLKIAASLEKLQLFLQVRSRCLDFAQT
ncbi:MAG: IS1380 family transposase [Candidatus Aminicenantales bacterium]